MSKNLTFRVELQFESNIEQDEDIMQVAQNIARAIVAETNGQGISPQNGDTYLCKPCDAYVGCHKESTKALGRLANKELRFWKKEAHKYFDIIWKEKHLTRKESYQHLSNHLKLPIYYTHIGMFSVDTCKKVVDWSKMILNDLRRLDMDFGVDVKRPHYER